MSVRKATSGGLVERGLLGAHMKTARFRGPTTSVSSMYRANSPTATATTVTGTMKADEAQAGSPEGSQVSAVELQADLDDNNQMVSEGGPSG